MKIKLFMCFAVTSLAAALATQAAPYVVLAGGQQKVGTVIRAKPDGTVILTAADGTFTYAKGQYVKAVADKPPDFDSARQKAAAKDYDGATAILKRIISEMSNLEWDNNARIVLAREVFAAKGDFASAVSTYDDIFRIAPEMKNNSDAAWAYRDALLGAKQFDKLGLALDELIKGGARPDAAKAQVMRGDIKMSQGQVEGAAMDYLRTVILFDSEKDAQPEALFKAAGALEKLRDPRAKTMYEKLRNEYASSPYAAQAAGK